MTVITHLSSTRYLIPQSKMRILFVQPLIYSVAEGSVGKGSYIGVCLVGLQGSGWCSDRGSWVQTPVGPRDFLTTSTYPCRGGVLCAKTLPPDQQEGHT